MLNDDKIDIILILLDSFFSYLNEPQKKQQYLSQIYQNIQIISPNKVQIIKYLSKGSYGSVSLAKIDDKNVVIKTPLNDEYIQDFVMENLFHLLLTCFKDEIITNKYLIYPIPKLYYFVRDGTTPIAIMQKLEISLGDLILQRLLTDSILFDIISQVALYLYILQNNVGFMHRDLYFRNVMLGTIHSEKERYYYIENEVEYSLYTNYQVYLIDFGQSCFDLRKCGACNMPVKTTFTAGGFSYKNKYKTFCKNYSYDLKVLLGSLYYDKKDMIAYKIRNKYHIFYSFLEGLFKDYNIDNWHIIYKTIQEEDKNFNPLSILKNIEKIGKYKPKHEVSFHSDISEGLEEDFYERKEKSPYSLEEDFYERKEKSQLSPLATEGLKFLDENDEENMRYIIRGIDDLLKD